MWSAVLIVDDSLTVRMDLGDAFQAAGFSPTLASTVAEARRALEQRPYALVILDVVLPDGDGLALLREVKASSPTTPVMLLSAESEVAARLRGLRTGADEYVGKPYDMSYVLARARQLIRSVSSREANGTRILVVDDSLTFREQLRETLEGEGYTVLLSESGEEALHMAVDARPAAIVVDGILPGIDGPTFIRRVREDALLRRTPCILLTASEGRGEVFALDSGADAYMQKDASTDKIHNLLGQHLPVGVGCRPEHQHRPAEQIIHRCARDLGLEEIGNQPGFHPFQLADLDHLFHLPEVGVRRAQDHPVDGMFVQHPDNL